MGPLNRYGWWKRQDGAIRQQLIEQLTREICTTMASFAVKSDLRSRLSREALTAVRVDGARGPIRPTPTLDNGGGPGGG